MNYAFEREQKILIKLFDSDGTKEHYEHIGTCETTLAAILGADKNVHKTKFQSNTEKMTTNPELYISADAIKESNFAYEMSFSFSGAGNLRCDLWESITADTYFQFYRKVGDHWVKTYKTPKVKNPWRPRTEKFIIPLQVLSNADPDAEICIKVMRLPATECNKVEFNVKDLENKNEFNGTKSGSRLIFHEKKLIEIPSFLEYLTSGWKV